MNKQLKKKWVEALRSGEYIQCHGRLRTRDNRFCCLGVLCDIIDPSKWKGFGTFYKYDGQMVVLPESVIKAAKIDGFGTFNEKTKECLMNLNDIKRLSFKEIADVIEREL